MAQDLEPDHDRLKPDSQRFCGIPCPMCVTLSDSWFQGYRAIALYPLMR